MDIKRKEHKKFEYNEPKFYYLWETTTSSYLDKEAMQIQLFAPYNRDPEKSTTHRNINK